MRRHLLLVLPMLGLLLASGPGARTQTDDAKEPTYKGKTARQWAAALRDPDWYERRRAAVSLGKFGPKAREAVPALARALKDPDRYVRTAAATALGEIGPGATKAVPPLAAALKDPEPWVREAAAYALGQIGWTALSARPALEALKKDRIPSVQAAAVQALLHVSPAAKPIPVLLDDLKSPDANTRREACLVLGQRWRAAGPVVPALLRALKDPDRSVREASAAALRRIDSVPLEILPDLVAGLRDPEVRVRRAACGLLGRMADASPSAVPALLRALNDPDRGVREVGGSALLRTVSGLEISGRLGQVDKRALQELPALAAALEDKSSSVRCAAAAVLLCLGQGEIGSTPELRATLKKVQGGWGCVAQAALRGSDRESRLLALARVVRLGKGAAFAAPELVAVLSRSPVADLRERVGAAIALGEVGGPAARPLLELVRARKEPNLYLALYALSRIGPEAKEAIPELRELLKSDNVWQRTGAAYALARISRKDRRQALEVLQAEIKAGHKAFDGAPAPTGKVQTLEASVLQALEASILVAWLAPKHPGEATALFVRTLQSSHDFFVAPSLYGLTLVGPAPRSAVPALRQAGEGPDPWTPGLTQTLAAYLLAQINPEDAKAIGTLKQFAAGKGDEDVAFGWIVRDNLIQGTPADRVLVAACCDSLRAREPGSRFPTSYLLEWIGQAARMPPNRVGAWMETHRFVPGLAREMLRRLNAGDTKGPGQSGKGASRGRARP